MDVAVNVDVNVNVAAKESNEHPLTPKERLHYEPAKAHTTYRLTAFALHQKNAVYSALPAYPSSHDLG